MQTEKRKSFREKKSSRLESRDGIRMEKTGGQGPSNGSNEVGTEREGFRQREGRRTNSSTERC